MSETLLQQGPPVHELGPDQVAQNTSMTVEGSYDASRPGWENNQPGLIENPDKAHHMATVEDAWRSKMDAVDYTESVKIYTNGGEQRQISREDYKSVEKLKDLQMLGGIAVQGVANRYDALHNPDDLMPPR